MSTMSSFDEAEKRTEVRQSEDGIPVKCLGSKDLLAAKEAAGREQDLEDAEFLRLKLANQKK